MPEDNSLDDLAWLVLVNASGAYCVWPAVTPVPAGWRETGPEGDRAACLAWIASRWTSLQPARAGIGGAAT